MIYELKISKNALKNKKPKYYLIEVHFKKQ